MLRLLRIVEDLVDRYVSGGFLVMLRITSIFSALLWVTHIVGCGWFALGRFLRSDTGAVLDARRMIDLCLSK